MVLGEALVRAVILWALGARCKMSKHDRAKSGGLLDTLFFGRPHKKGGRGGGGSSGYGGGSGGLGGAGSGHGGSMNGGRPLSGTESDLPNLEEISNAVKRMTEAEVNQKFLEILEDMNIPKDKRDPLLLKPLDEKRKMILMHMKGKRVAVRAEKCGGGLFVFVLVRCGGIFFGLQQVGYVRS